MTNQPENRSSSDIAAELAKIKKDFDEIKGSWTPLEEKYKEVRGEEKKLREQLDKVSRERVRLDNEVSDLKYSASQFPHKISKLESEYRRLIEQEALAKSMQRDIDAFKEKCLAATWRKENREDGEGALEHQIEGAIRLAVASSGYLFDKRGLGKTLTSLIWADLKDLTKIIIFVPNDICSQFVREVNLWSPHRTIIPFYQQNKQARDLWMSILPTMNEWTIVTNYQAWRRDWSIVEQFNKLQPEAIIADEAHNINKTDGLQWKGINHVRFYPNQCPLCMGSDIKYDVKSKTALCLKCGEHGTYSMNGKYEESYSEWTSVKNLVLMTGTPILNRPQEFYPLARLVEPHIFYSETEFLSDYCQHISGGRYTFQYGGQDRLLKRIGERVVLRDRKMAGVKIPDQKPQIHEIEFDAEKYPHQARALKNLREYAQLVLDEANEEVMKITEFITLLLRMRQGIVWPAGITLKVRDENKNVVFEKSLEVHESIKLDWTENMIREIVDEGERVVVFSHFKAPLNELNRRLYRESKGDPVASVIYDGDTPHSLRERIQRDFDPRTCGENPEWKVLLGNYRTGGTGINLHAATQMILLDEEWSPGKEDQAMGRIDRIGTTKETTVHIPRVLGSIDMWMAQLIEQKAQTVGSFDSAAKMASNLMNDIRRGKIL